MWDSPPCRPHWKSSASWPPEDAAGQPLVLHLTAPPPPTSATASSPGSVGSSPPAPAARHTGRTATGHSRRRVGRSARSVRACKDGRLEADAAAAAASTSMAVDTSRFLKVRTISHVIRACWCVICTLSGVIVRLPECDIDLASDPYLKHVSAHMWNPCKRQTYLTEFRASLPQGTSRFDVITQPTATIQYRRLRSAGHALFTGAPLAAELQVVGCAIEKLGFRLLQHPPQCMCVMCWCLMRPARWCPFCICGLRGGASVI
jgi:hypothetical protein